MPVPLALAAPAAAASMAYLNAKGGVWYDLILMKCTIKALARLHLAQRRDLTNLFYVLERHAQDPKRANKVFVIFEGKRHTYAQTYDKALRYGNYFKTELGVKPKDVVAMDFQNSDSFIFIWMGLWAIGAKPAFINYNLTSKPLVHCIKAATTKLCIIDPEIASNFDNNVKQELDGVNLVVFTPEVETAAASTASVRAPNSDRSEDSFVNMALLIYTSGTTGLPKPAIVAWGKCWGGATIAETLLGRGGDDIMYTSMPLYHSSASLLCSVTTLLAGSSQAIGRKFSTKTFWDEVRASKATMIQYVGETLRYLLAAPPQYDPVTGECLDKQHHVQLAFGNGLRPDVWDKFKDRFGIGTIAEFYASTEGPAATWNLSSNDFARGAIGRTGWLTKMLFGRGSVMVEVDWDTDMPKRNPSTGLCYRVKPGNPGELLFRLPSDNTNQRFQGYFNNPGATNSKILRDVVSKGDTWFRTGDVIRWDSDGRIFFSDRIGDTFRWKSENVSTAEVSEAVGLHPSVREANVYGVQLPHHDGRAGCVAIAFDEKAGGDPDAETLRSLATHVRSSLPRYAQPLFLRIIAGMGTAEQTTGTNKQQKHLLRAAGVKPRDMKKSDMYWLREDGYVPFGEKEWQELEGGRVKL